LNNGTLEAGPLLEANKNKKSTLIGAQFKSLFKSNNVQLTAIGGHNLQVVRKQSAGNQEKVNHSRLYSGLQRLYQFARSQTDHQPNKNKKCLR
jgi:hypothetical protein